MCTAGTVLLVTEFLERRSLPSEATIALSLLAKEDRNPSNWRVFRSGGVPGSPRAETGPVPQVDEGRFSLFDQTSQNRDWKKLPTKSVLCGRRLRLVSPLEREGSAVSRSPFRCVWGDDSGSGQRETAFHRAAAPGVSEPVGRFSTRQGRRRESLAHPVSAKGPLSSGAAQAASALGKPTSVQTHLHSQPQQRLLRAVGVFRPVSSTWRAARFACGCGRRCG